METRLGPGTAQRHDVPNLRERQSQSPTLLDEREHAQRVGRVNPVACRGTTRRREDAARFVESERLAARAAPCCHLANQEPVLHAGQDRACPKGQGQDPGVGTREVPVPSDTVMPRARQNDDWRTTPPGRTV